MGKERPHEWYPGSRRVSLSWGATMVGVLLAENESHLIQVIQEGMLCEWKGGSVTFNASHFLHPSLCQIHLSDGSDILILP
jgi:hypothetical protein